MNRSTAIAVALVLGACNSSQLAPDAGTSEPDAGDQVDAGPRTPSLQETLELASQSVTEFTGGEVSVAVYDLATKQRADIGGDVLHISASSAKVYWAGAALHSAGVLPVSGSAVPVFETSDNLAAGALIDFSGPDAVNTWQWSVGLENTALTYWGFGMPRIADNSPRLLGENNYTTANDAVHFLTQLAEGTLLPAAESEALLGWMRLSPRQGFGGWFGNGLPEDAQATYHHKAGWLPPGCCSSDPDALLDIGIVPHSGGRFVYAVLMRKGSWEAQLTAMPFLACTAHSALTGLPQHHCELLPSEE